MKTDPVALLEELAKKWRDEADSWGASSSHLSAMKALGYVSCADELDAAIALMRGQSWKRELIDDMQRRFEVGEVPKMTEARAEYWKAGARWAIGIANVAIHELHNVPKDPADEQ